MDLEAPSYVTLFGAVGTLAFAVAFLAGVRERRERSRPDLDRISAVPWRLISVLFSMLAIMFVATAVRAWFTASG
jgi:hypothetical protein